ncbi:LysR substrate-binding domain-containing protein [Marivita sp.]|uniref:LysR substrate-binding domain-containing protein n=1 Tax=Marivita sp. TaxID=2003365 RepID=UPI0025C02AD1|nr:LysR substrate-binding domain-containing protein [Marivita sp.]
MTHGAFEFFQLRCFVAVATELNFRRAAARMNMTQPPLSRQIKLLEHGVGVTLLDRDQSGVRLTPAGQTFLAAATELLQRAEAALLSARQAARGEAGAVVIGFVPSAAIEFIPRMVVALKAQLPDVSFTVTELMSYEIVEGLLSGQLDLGLTRANSTRGGIESVRVVNEPFVLAMPADHPLENGRDLTLADLDGVEMVGYSADRGGVLRDILKKAYTAAEVNPVIIQEVSQTHAVLSLVNGGLGAALVPRSAQGVHMANMVFAQIEMSDRYRSMLYLNSGPDRDSALDRRVREIVIDALGKASAPPEI